MALHLCRRNLSSALNLSNSTISIYLLTSPLSYYSTTTLSPQPSPSIADYLIKSHQLSPETASKASSSLTHLNFDKADLIINYLKEFGFSTSHLDMLLKRTPNVLSAKLDQTLKPKLLFLQGLGISPPDIVELLSVDPYILSRDITNQIAPSFLALKTFLGSEANVVKVLKASTAFLKYNLDKTMVPSIQLLKSCGISQSQITQFILNFPRLFLYKPEAMKEYISKVDEMGLSRDSKMFMHAVRVISSMSKESWESKLELFRSLGFTEEDILSVFRKSPQVFAPSERKIKEVSDILITAADCDGKFPVSHADLLVCSVKNRIIPRLKVMDTLEANNLIKRRPSVRTLLKLSSEQFFIKYVAPYSDVVGELYVADRKSVV